MRPPSWMVIEQNVDGHVLSSWKRAFFPGEGLDFCTSEAGLSAVTSSRTPGHFSPSIPSQLCPHSLPSTQTMAGTGGWSMNLGPSLSYEHALPAVLAVLGAFPSYWALTRGAALEAVCLGQYVLLAWSPGLCLRMFMVKCCLAGTCTGERVLSLALARHACFLTLWRENAGVNGFLEFFEGQTQTTAFRAPTMCSLCTKSSFHSWSYIPTILSIL